MKPPRESVRALARSLVGTCNNMVDEIEALSLEECHEFDGLIFECVDCNWWFPKNQCHEIDGQWLCKECAL